LVEVKGSLLAIIWRGLGLLVSRWERTLEERLGIARLIGDGGVVCGWIWLKKVGGIGGLVGCEWLRVVLVLRLVEGHRK
jgi:hypothetical protein